ncbi:hypothetical protein LCGC14_2647010 [marine sediment metagenome]|uniref:Uncharacterized protein n=1 Tax=marine sediment metagenome TaxID=412755 RepID=A0A0F9C6D9_9ZZZZ
MSDKPLETHLTYFGISPWEIEVVYGLLNSRFKVIQNEIENEEDSELASMLNIDIPLPFNEEFFKWFEYSRWDKMKFLFKEMKRRRGGKHAIKIQINSQMDQYISRGDRREIDHLCDPQTPNQNTKKKI